MKIQCPQCQAEFRVDAAKIPEKGCQGTCKKCGTGFFLTPQGVRAGETRAMADGGDLSELEVRLGRLIAADDQDAAADLFLEMITRCTKARDFDRAAKLHARMYDETPMALNAIIAAGETIEAQKGDMIDPGHLDLWEGIYSQLTPEETTTFHFALEEISCVAGETVFKQGDVDGRLFLVEAGRLKMVCTDPSSSSEILIQKIQTGEVFGADHFFSFSVCTYSAVVVEDCRLKCLEKSYRFKWLEELPGLENKLQVYCNTLEKASDVIVRQNIERRSHASRSSSVRASIETIDSDRFPGDWSRTARFSEVSPHGACLDLRLNKPADAEALLGGDLKISFKLQVAGVSKKACITARVVAVDFLSFGGCAMHIQFTKALSEKSLALF